MQIEELELAAIICELVCAEDRLTARRDNYIMFGKKFGLKAITIAALVEYLKRQQLQKGNSSVSVENISVRQITFD